MKKKRRNLSKNSKQEIEAKCLMVEVLKYKYAIQYLCKVLSLNRSYYYYFLNTKANEETEEIKQNILIIFKNSKETYGRRRITAAMNQQMGKCYNVKRVYRFND